MEEINFLVKLLPFFGGEIYWTRNFADKKENFIELDKDCLKEKTCQIFSVLRQNVLGRFVERYICSKNTVFVKFYSRLSIMHSLHGQVKFIKFFRAFLIFFIRESWSRESFKENSASMALLYSFKRSNKRTKQVEALVFKQISIKVYQNFKNSSIIFNELIKNSKEQLQSKDFTKQNPDN